ncbi:S1C family serine protease [Pseudonocardia xinjiangensis]|uniref:S1C family serine protease n=1 Tax=Pseudonocardia xinjiangensis TaxID=75289 RepID=UPI001B7D0564|nr:trypsin-like peptidase domain-containing protein [Pseudonocardia xinjiangensis]
MSDEQREQGRDASASTDGPRTDQHPVPSYAPGHEHTVPNSMGPGAMGPEAPGANPYSTAAYPSHAGYPPYGAPAAAPAPGKQRRPRTMAGIVAAALVAGVVGGGAAFGGAYALLGDQPVQTMLTSAPASPASTTATPGTVAAAAQKAMPSTVDIRVNLAQGTAEGSGVILTADGDVLTNNHVVAGSTGQIVVTLADGSQHPATVVGTSPSYDLAVIKLQGVSGLTPATLGQSSSLQVGQQVVAIGSPQGLTGTVTTGIVSAFDRTVQVQGEDGSSVVYNGLQTDAPINPGNSGGPLVNLDGQVIGINSAIATGGGQSDGSVGLGFSIPIDQAKRVAQELINSGTATKPVLGVQGNASSSGGTGGGAPIAAVQPGSPAAQAGLAAGDVVTKVGTAPVQNFADLIARIGANDPGQQVALTVQGTNGGATRTVNVTLGSQPDKAATTAGGGQSQGGNNPFGGQNPFGGGNGFGGGGNGGGNGNGGGGDNGNGGGDNGGGSDSSPFGN